MLDGLLAGVAPETRDRLTRTNAARLYGFDLDHATHA
jgi:hypothetical protein